MHPGSRYLSQCLFEPSEYTHAELDFRQPSGISLRQYVQAGTQTQPFIQGYLGDFSPDA